MIILLISFLIQYQAAAKSSASVAVKKDSVDIAVTQLKKKLSIIETKYDSIMRKGKHEHRAKK